MIVVEDTNTLLGPRVALGRAYTKSIENGCDVRPVVNGPDHAARHDHVYMRVVGQCRAPGVQDRQGADASAKMLGMGCKGEHGLG